MYSGEYYAALAKHGNNNIEKQSLSLGIKTFVLEEKTSTASIIYCVWQNKSAELCKGKMQSPALNFCA